MTTRARFVDFRASAAAAMHAILVTVGTDGDIFPYAALGSTLRARGHRTTLGLRPGPLN
jgi:Glycosyltransferase family 28 N-terminal domain